MDIIDENFRIGLPTVRARQRLARTVFMLALLVGFMNGCRLQPVPEGSNPPDDTPASSALVSSASPVFTPFTPFTPIQQASATPTATSTPAPTHLPTQPSTKPPSPTVTPPALETFSHRLVRPGVSPQTYLTDPCEYLRLRWSPDKAQPGSVVVPIMFHGIRAAGKSLIEDDSISITEEQFNTFVAYAKSQGYDTITAQQLLNFLVDNTSIPPRSMILIVDDRRPGTVENYFLPAAEANNWQVTLGWIIADTKDTLWAWMERLNESGRLDIQSHGYLHRYITDSMPEETIREEIFTPISILEEHFGQKPIAFIWPGGNFTEQSVGIARESGYQLGFTAFSRGPLMFNWIPQGQPEQVVGDPFMTLPRFWSTDITLPLDVGVQIGDAARAAAEAIWPTEAIYYQTYCGGILKR